MLFPFGQYKDQEIDFILDFDRPYCEYVLGFKNIQTKHPEFWQVLSDKLKLHVRVESPINEMSFGKYYLLEMEEFIHDKSYCKWLLSKDSFSKEYPKQYEYLQRLFDLVYEEQADSKFIYFYVLFFQLSNEEEADYIKVGKTTQFIVKRIYNYAGIMTYYSSRNIDFVNSFLYKTNYLDTEKSVLKHFSKERMDKKTERLQLEISGEVDHFIKDLAKEKKEYYFLKKPMTDFIPFADSADFNKAFSLKSNQFVDFEKHYEKFLKENGLYHLYNPHFLGSAN